MPHVSGGLDHSPTARSSQHPSTTQQLLIDRDEVAADFLILVPPARPCGTFHLNILGCFGAVKGPDGRAIGIARFAAQSRGAACNAVRFIQPSTGSSAVRRSRLWAGVRVQRHRDDKRGAALRSLYNNFCPHLLGQNLDQARAKTGWLV